MNENEFTSKISGEVRSSYGQYVYFQPHDLPFDINLSKELSRKSMKALILLSRLDGKASEIDEMERDVFLKAFTLKESSHSSSIEGTRSTMDDLYLYEKNPPDTENRIRDSKEVMNYKEALDIGFKAVREGRRIDVELLHNMHRKLMEGVRGENKSPGEFKKTQNAIGRPGDTLDTAKMVPAPPETVDHLIGNLLDYIYSDDDPLMKIALVHYQFECIHPYRDGNGRIGRLLILLILAMEDILHYPVIYPSEYFDRRRDEYIDGLFDVCSKDKFDEWFDFFFDAMIEQSKESMIVMDGLRSYKRRLKSIAKTKTESDVIDLLFINPYINSKDIIGYCDVSAPTANKILSFLEEKGIIREITGKKKNTMYSADGVLEILSGRIR